MFRGLLKLTSGWRIFSLYSRPIGGLRLLSAALWSVVISMTHYPFPFSIYDPKKATYFISSQSFKALRENKPGVHVFELSFFSNQCFWMFLPLSPLSWIRTSFWKSQDKPAYAWLCLYFIYSDFHEYIHLYLCYHFSLTL